MTTKKMKWIKGEIHKNKSKANEVIKACKILNVRYRVVKLKDGYRVDTKY